MRSSAPGILLCSAGLVLFVPVVCFAQSATVPVSNLPKQTSSVDKPAVDKPAVDNAVAKSAGDKTDADKYKNEALIWEHFDTTIHMHADGTGDRIMRVVVRLQSEGAARQFSVLSVPYASAYETGAIDYIRVHKPDGTTVETPVSDAIEMPAAVTREAPLYSDLKEKQLPVRSLAAGDVLEYQFHTERNKAEAPGQFWGAEHFLMQGGVVLSQTLTLEVPASKYVQIWDPKHPAKPVQSVATPQGGGLLTYTWTSAQLKPTPKPKDPAAKSTTTAADSADEIKDLDQDADGRNLPSVGWTTFHSWAEVGDWYRGLAHGRSDPTPAIQARAAELTKDAKTPDEQVRALYDYVSTKTRYVGIDFGVGRYQPHTADEVMDHQYGDCKDKSTLLESLLRAKGFTAAPALIGANIAPVPDLPSPALFNHVITTVEMPSGSATPGRIWLDTTPEVEPYRVLIPYIRDEQALVVPADGPASLQRTPVDPPFAYRERFEATGTLDKDGLLKTHMDLTMRSDNEFGYRILLQRAAPAQWDEAMQSVSSAMGFGGTVSNTDLKQTDPAGPVHISFDYSRSSFADWEHLRILPLFPYLEITTIDKDKAPEHDIDQGTARTLEATTKIQLPEGYRAELPDAIHVKKDYATFDQTYRLEKGELTIERKTVILKKKVPKADWKDYVAYTRSIGMESGENYIVLYVPPPVIKLPAIKITASEKGTEPTPASVGDKAQPPSTSAVPAISDVGPEHDARMAAFRAERSMLDAMMKSARQLELDNNWEGARAMLNEVKAKQQDYLGLMVMFGDMAIHDGKPDEATLDFEAEAKNHSTVPSSVVVKLANAYATQKRYGEAEALLRKYLERNDAILFVALADAQTRSGDDVAAASTLEKALASHPGDSSIRTPLIASLHRLHRDKEAAAITKSRGFSSPFIAKTSPQVDTKKSIANIEPSTTTTGAAATARTDPTTVTDAEIPQLMKDAFEMLRSRDTAGARAKLDEVRRARPDYPYLMSMLGSVALEDGKTDEGIEDMKMELKNHPDADTNIILTLATSYAGQKRDDEAIATLKNYSGRGDIRIIFSLTQLQTQKGDNAGALETLQAAATAHPDNLTVQTQMADVLHRLHRDTEAAAAAKVAMDGSDDPGVLNDAAYELGETRLDLPLAEKNSRRAVEMLETASTQTTLQEANSKAFQQTELLIASWDTLGWILFQEGKAADAEPYIAAAWFQRPELVVGNHLAQIREALGKPSEALTIDDLALASDSNANDKDAKAQVTENAERLRKAGAKSSAGNAMQKLQDLRTFQIERVKDLKGWGTFRVQIAAVGVHDSDLVNGGDVIRPMIPELNKLKIPGAVPPGSPAMLIRDGVLSCSSTGATCEFVLMPHSGLGPEGVN